MSTDIDTAPKLCKEAMLRRAARAAGQPTYLGSNQCYRKHLPPLRRVASGECFQCSEDRKTSDRARRAAKAVVRPAVTRIVSGVPRPFFRRWRGSDCFA
jgi:hypothetical protein